MCVFDSWGCYWVISRSKAKLSVGMIIGYWLNPITVVLILIKVTLLSATCLVEYTLLYSSQGPKINMMYFFKITYIFKWMTEDVIRFCKVKYGILCKFDRSQYKSLWFSQVTNY